MLSRLHGALKNEKNKMEKELSESSMHLFPTKLTTGKSIHGNRIPNRIPHTSQNLNNRNMKNRSSFCKKNQVKTLSIEEKCKKGAQNKLISYGIAKSHLVLGIHSGYA